MKLQVLLVPLVQTLSVIQHDSHPGVCIHQDSELKKAFRSFIFFFCILSCVTFYFSLRHKCVYFCICLNKKHKTAICDSPCLGPACAFGRHSATKNWIVIGVISAYIWFKGYSVCPFCWRSAVCVHVSVPLCCWIMLELRYLHSPSSFWRCLHTDLWLSLQLPGWVIRSCLLHQACFNISE